MGPERERKSPRNEVPPTVKHLILCDRAKADPANPRRLNIEGVVDTILARGPLTFPVVQRELTLLVVLSSCRGGGVSRVVVRGETNEEVRSTTPRHVKLPFAPLAVVPLAFRMRDVSFPAAGVYYFEFWFNGVRIGERPVTVREDA